MRTLALGACLGLCAMVAAVPGAQAAEPQSADDLIVVDCLLPGQIRQLARNTTYLSARRPVKTTAFDCRVRNGEYVVEDRASLATALKVWLAAAQAGDVEAQTTVGEIFERGLGVPPDYAAAASWYRRAADAGYARAQINLGNLYERGLGMPRDPQTALAWYRRAAGLDAGIRLDTAPDVAPVLAAQAQERARLEDERRRLVAEVERLRGELDAARRDAPAGSAPESASGEVESLRQRVAAREGDLEALRAELVETRARLAAASRAVEEARAAAAAESAAAAEQNRALAQSRDEAARHQAELVAVLERLAERERALSERAEALAATEARLDRLEAAASAPAPIGEDEVAEGLLAGPEIALIDPTLPRTRGLVKVSVPAQLERRRIVGRVTAPAGLLTLAVNDTPAEPNAAGVFVAEVALRGGDGTVTVAAVDRQGKRNELRFVLAPSDSDAVPVVAASAPQAVLPPVDFGRYYALLIGNESYAELPRLNTPGADVDALDRILKARFGFETTVVRDATRYEILSALNDMRARLTRDDNLLVYYAGHGELDEVNMRGHWLPVDAEADSTANWISNVTITDILNVIPAKQVMLVVDSCYSGTLTRSTIAGQATTQTDEERLTWLKLMAKKRARVVLTSGALAPVLDAGGGRHSVFAKALLETLESLGDVTEGQALHRAIAARVAHAAATFRFEQTPQFAPIAHAGHESGDFFLLPRTLVLPRTR